MENKLSFGHLELVIDEISGGLTHQEQELIYLKVQKMLIQNIKNNNYNFDVTFELISVEMGCIKFNVELFIKVASFGASTVMLLAAASTIFANYHNFKASAPDLWSPSKEINYIEHNGKPVQVHMHRNNMTSEVYGPVEKGETLSEIILKMDRKRYSKNQFMVGLLVENPTAFQMYNINKLKIGALLKSPCSVAMHGITEQRADRVVAEHNERHSK